MTDEITTASKSDVSHRGLALVVAVANYIAINSLPNVVLNDARDLSAILTDPLLCGYELNNVNILLDGEATGGAIREGLDRLAKNARPEDSVIVFFSGHGGLLSTSQGDTAALLAHDFALAEPTNGALFEADLTDALSKILSQRLLVLLDACHSGGTGNLKSLSTATLTGFSEKSLTRLAQGRGRVIISSSRETEFSIVTPGARNSLFSKHLLGAFKGQAVTKGDGLIRVFDVFNHVVENVRREYPHQHPVLKAHNVEDNFPIALEHRGAKMSSIMSEEKTIPLDFWEDLGEILPVLYPLGPMDLEIWSRSGGDPSRLRNAATPRSKWFSALKTLRQGGGGVRITAVSLIRAALDDYPQHHRLRTLRAKASEGQV